MTLLFGWAASLIGPRFAKPVTIAVLILLAVLAILAAKSCYDSSVIEDARRAGNAEAIELKAKADEHAAEARGHDQQRAATEAEQLKETVDEAVEQGADPRAAYYACLRLQQSARAANRPAPAC